MSCPRVSGTLLDRSLYCIYYWQTDMTTWQELTGWIIVFRKNFFYTWPCRKKSVTCHANDDDADGVTAHSSSETTTLMLVCCFFLLLISNFLIRSFSSSESWYTYVHASSSSSSQDEHLCSSWMHLKKKIVIFSGKLERELSEINGIIEKTGSNRI